MVLIEILFVSIFFTRPSHLYTVYTAIFFLFFVSNSEAIESHDTPQPCSYLTQVYAATLSPWVPAFLEVLREHSSEKKIKRRHRQVSFIF